MLGKPSEGDVVNKTKEGTRFIRCMWAIREGPSFLKNTVLLISSASEGRGVLREVCSLFSTFFS